MVLAPSKRCPQEVRSLALPHEEHSLGRLLELLDGDRSVGSQRSSFATRQADMESDGHGASQSFSTGKLRYGAALKC